MRNLLLGLQSPLPQADQSIADATKMQWQPRDHITPKLVSISLRRLFLQDFLQFAFLIHLGQDVGAADKLTIDIKLRDGRPVGKFLYALPDIRIFEHIDRIEVRDAARAQYADDIGGKTALWKVGRTFHVQHDPVFADLLFDNILNAHAFSLLPD